MMIAGDKVGRKQINRRWCENLVNAGKEDRCRKMKAPAFKVVLVGVGRYAYRRDDGVMVVPISCLKD